MIHKYKLWVFLTVILINLLAVFVFYQTRPVYNIAPGEPGDSWYIDKFYQPETNPAGSYRWSQDGATATLPSVGSPFQIRLEATAYRPAGIPSPTFELELNNPGLKASFQGVPDTKIYIFPVRARPDLSPGTHTLTIHSPTFQPGQNDDRKLGLLIKQITVQAEPNSLGFVLPPVMAWLSLSLGLALTQSLVFFRLLRRLPKRPYLVWSGLVLPAGLLGLALLQPAFALENAYSVGVGFVALGLAGLALQELPAWRLAAGAVLTVLTVLGVLFNLFNFLALAVFCVGLVIIALFYNPRLNRDRFNLLIVANIAILPAWGLLQQRAYQTIDGESHHFYWLNELDLLVKEGDFFPRWAPHFSYERGSTVFNFYAPLSRYLAEFFVLGGLTPAIAFLAALLVITVGSGLSMYWLARDFTSGPGAVVAAVAYLYHPYRLADLYQRGDIAEALNFVFFPLALLAVSRVLRFHRPPGLNLFIGGALAFGFMLVSHQLSAFYFGLYMLAPFVLLCLVWYFWQERRAFVPALRTAFSRLAFLAGLAGLGVALSAFYILPVVLESKNIRVGNKVGIDWGYGFLNDTVSNWKDWFSAIRPPEYADRSMTNLAWFGPLPLVLALLGVLCGWLPFNRQSRDNRRYSLFFGLIIGLLLLLQLQVFQPFWENTPGMVFIQFPWRLMIYVSLMSSVLTGVLAGYLFRLARRAALRRLAFPEKARARSGSRRTRRLSYPAGLLVVFLLGLLLAYSGAGKISLKYYPPSFSGKYSLGTLVNQIENGDIFYLPNWARSLDTLEKEPDLAFVERAGQPQADPVSFKRLKSAEYRLEVNLAQPGNLIIPVFYFDGWNLTANNQSLPVSYNQPQGYIRAAVPAGQYSMALRFENSLPRTAGITLTGLAWLLLAGLVVRRRMYRPKVLQPAEVAPDLTSKT